LPLYLYVCGERTRKIKIDSLALPSPLSNAID
jgi:hypothetical protein